MKSASKKRTVCDVQQFPAVQKRIHCLSSRDGTAHMKIVVLKIKILTTSKTSCNEGVTSVQAGHPLLTLTRAFVHKLLSNGLGKVWEPGLVERLCYSKKNPDVLSTDRDY